MLGLPRSTEYNKRIPKQKFYENLQITPVLKRAFVDQIRNVYWRNKIAASTTNLAQGKIVNEVEFFEINLNSVELDEAVLRQMDREIPYHIVFLLEYDGKYQAWTAYKENTASGNNAFKVGNYYHTEWMKENELPIHIEGLNMDTVYENFVRQIAGSLLQIDNYDENLKESVIRDDKRKNLMKQIETLQTQIRKEKQFNKQIKYNNELKIIEEQLRKL